MARRSRSTARPVEEQDDTPTAVSAGHALTGIDETTESRLREAFEHVQLELQPTIVGARALDGTTLHEISTLIAGLVEDSGLRASFDEMWGHDLVVGDLAVDLAWRPKARAASVVRVLGGVNAAARQLDVAPSQVSRWTRGESQPGPTMARRLLDLDHVIAQAQLLWADDEVIRDWLTTDNQHLGARPVEVVATRGSGPVVDAIRAELSGAYA